jgi:hypothetical protein
VPLCKIAWRRWGDGIGRATEETDSGYSSLTGLRLSEGERKLRVGRGVAQAGGALRAFYRLEVGGGWPAWDFNGRRRVEPLNLRLQGR